MKIFALILILIFVVVNNLSAVIKNHSFSSTNQLWVDNDPTQADETYLTVQVYCNEVACTLYCNEPDQSGSTCNWSNYTSCIGCVGNYSVWNDSDSEYLFEYAKSQIESNNNSGQYSLNYTNNNITYYRSVTWSFNSTNGEATINITVSFDDGL